MNIPFFNRKSRSISASNTAFEARSLAAAQAEIQSLRAQVNRYESAMPSGPSRPYIPSFVRDARFDANSFTRWEMVRKIRDMAENTYLCQRIRDEFTKWTVGPNGLPVIPASSDENWNRGMQEAYEEFAESPYLDSTLSMGQGDQVMAGTFSIDGELFQHHTRLKLAGKPSKPALQLIEGHRCSSPGKDFTWGEQNDIVDGVQLGRDEATNRVVKPVGYWIRDNFEASEWTFRPLETMHHIFMPERIGMYRAVTPYHAVIPTLQDLFLLEDFEMGRAKQNSEIAYWIKNSAGEIPAAQILRDSFVGKSAQSNVSATDESMDRRLDMYRRIFGPKVNALKTNEDVIQFDSKSPSAATQWLWRYKVGQVCASQGVPLLLVFPELIESMQGTAVRAILDNAHLFFRSRFFIFAQAAKRRYKFFADWARFNDKRCVDAPADWAKCHVIPPRAVNVDVGYTSESTIAELAAGLTSYSDVAGMHGTTGEVMLTKKAMDVAMIKRIAEEVSQCSGQEVKPEEIAGGLADILATLAKANMAKAGAFGPEINDPQKAKELAAA